MFLFKRQDCETRKLKIYYLMQKIAITFFSVYPFEKIDSLANSLLPYQTSLPAIISRFCWPI